VRISSSRLDLEDAALHGKEAHIEGAAAQIEDEDEVGLLAG
jgi:hypothetical protein